MSRRARYWQSLDPDGRTDLPTRANSYFPPPPYITTRLSMTGFHEAVASRLITFFMADPLSLPDLPVRLAYTLFCCRI